MEAVHQVAISVAQTTMDIVLAAVLVVLQVVATQAIQFVVVTHVVLLIIRYAAQTDVPYLVQHVALVEAPVHQEKRAVETGTVATQMKRAFKMGVSSLIHAAATHANMVVAVTMGEITHIHALAPVITKGAIVKHQLISAQVTHVKTEPHAPNMLGDTTVCAPCTIPGSTVAMRLTTVAAALVCTMGHVHQYLVDITVDVHHSMQVTIVEIRSITVRVTHAKMVRHVFRT